MEVGGAGLVSGGGGGEGGGVDGGGIVAEFDEEGAGGGGVGDREDGAGEAVGDGVGVGEGGVGADGLQEEEVGADEAAGGCEIGGALEVAEGGEADEGAEGEPIALAGWVVGCFGRCGEDGKDTGLAGDGDLRAGGGGWLIVAALAFGGRGREDGAETEGAEGAGAEGAQGIEAGYDGFGVLEDEAAGGSEGEHRAKGAVRGFYLDATVAGEVVAGFEGEGEVCCEGKVVGAGECDGGAGEWVEAAADDGEGGARGEDGECEGKAATVVEDDLGAEFVAGVGGGIGGVERQGETKAGGGVGGGCVGGVGFRLGRGVEGEVAEGDFLNAAEVRAGE